MKKKYLNRFCALCALLLCTVEYLHAQPKVILKLDDLSAKNNTCAALPVMEYLINRNVKASYGVIANRLDATAESVLHDVLAARDTEGRSMVEIWNHGFFHLTPVPDEDGYPYEFKGAPYASQKKYFEDAHVKVKQHLGVDMITFGAPYNLTDSVTYRVINENPSYKYAFFVREEVPFALNFNRLNNNVPMENGPGNPNFEYFKMAFNRRSGPCSNQVIVLQGHPNQWSDVNGEKFKEFEKILDYLEGLGCEFITPQMLLPPPSAPGELLFHSGFEGTTALINDADAQKLSITGIDNTVSAPNNWGSLSPYIGNFKFEFEGGDDNMRKADIIQEPVNPSNKVLRYWLADVNAANYTKGRVQSNAYNGSGIKEIYQSVRMYLSPDFNTLKTWNESFKWLTIFEFWNNKAWGNPMPYPFRISVNIVKPDTAQNTGLYFRATAQTYSSTFTDNWSVTNMNYEVPIGKWITMEYYYKEGGVSDGRFYLAMTPDGESKVVLVDENNRTRHADKTNSLGLQNFNPMKLYTSKEIINFMKSEGKTLEIYWDDFALWKDKRP